MRTTEAFDYERDNMRFGGSRCPACGQARDNCLGHGEIGDPAGYEILLEHDHDIHVRCHADSWCLPAPLADIRTRVERGAALLDEVRPGWWRDIEVEDLRMAEPCNCIMGQLSSEEYLTGLHQIVIPEFRNEDSMVWEDFIGYAHGLYSRRHADYSVLDEEWLLAIEERRS